MKKKFFPEEEINNIINDYLNNMRVYDMCEKYKIGKLRLHEILNENDVEKRKNLNVKRDELIFGDIEKYPQTKEYEYIVYDDKNPKFHTRDIKNSSGVISKYLLKQYKIDTPSDHMRKTYYMKTGYYWWEKYLSVKKVSIKSKEEIKIQNDKKEIKEINCVDNTDDYVICQICGGKFSRLDNAHLKKHNMTLTEYKSIYGDNSTVSKKLHNVLSKRKDVIKVEEREANFIAKGKEIHSNEKLDYSRVHYINNYTPVEIVDNDLKEDGTPYGSYWIIPYHFLRGSSHPLKKGLKIKNKKLVKTEELIVRFKNAHPNENLDYSQMNYQGMNKKIKVISHDKRLDGTEYGEFWITPNNHLKGGTHPELGKFNGDNKKRGTLEKLIERLKKIRDDIEDLDFSKANYINNKTKIKVICKKHDEFWITLGNLIKGNKCPKCANRYSSKEEEIYNYICEWIGIENVIRHSRNIINKLELDIFTPNLNFAVEYNGLHWHTTNFGCDANYHINKTLKCEEKNIVLYQIFEDEYLNNKNLVLSRLKHFLHKNYDLPKIDGRKCDIHIINDEISNNFLKKFNIKNNVKCGINIGAFHNENLIGVMIFKPKEDLFYELTTIFTDINYRCCGVIGKMFNFFVKNVKFSKIESSIDRRYFKGFDDNVLSKLQFTFVGYSAPTKFLTPHSKVRIKEEEAKKDTKYYEIYDCGTVNFEFLILK